MKLFKLIVFALSLFFPLTSFAGPYEHCLERLLSVSNKVSVVSDRFLFYERSRPNACLVSEPRQITNLKFNGSLGQCAREIFAKRAQYREFRDNLTSTIRSFCGNRPTSCPMPPVPLMVSGTINNPDECWARFDSAREYNRNLRNMLVEARTSAATMNEEHRRICGSSGYPGDPSSGGGAMCLSASSDATELEMCLMDLRCVTDTAVGDRSELERIHDSILRKFEHICDCTL